MFKKIPRYLMFTAMALAVSACSSSDNPSSDSPMANQPPLLSGTPPSTAVLNSQYSFKPGSSDPENNALTFAITNKPTWATFDNTSGALTGIPLIQHVGTYANIMIGASDGQSSAELPAFDIEVVQMASGSLLLAWTPPTQSADGSPLNDLASYRIRWGTQSGDHPNLQEVDNPGISSVMIEGLAEGNYFFIVSAVDSSNNESQASNEVSGTVP